VVVFQKTIHEEEINLRKNVDGEKRKMSLDVLRNMN
jgi:hypothetical protein